MLTPDMRIFIQFPEEQRPQVLHAASIESVEASRVIAAAEENFLPLEVGLEVAMYYEDRRRFQRQQAKVVSTLSGPKPRFAAEMIGQPVQAENRKCYRVSQPLVELTCTFHGREHCSIEDLAVTGFAVVTRDEISIGDSVEVVLYDIRDRPCTGRVVVRSVRSLARGHRYGVEVCDPAGGGAPLQRVVSALSQSQQRKELRRLAASA